MPRFGRSYPAPPIFRPRPLPTLPFTGPTFDAVSTPVKVVASTESWTHINNGNLILVGVGTGTNGYGPSSGWTNSVTCGGTAMTNIGTLDINNQSGYPYLDVWRLSSPSQGSQTISVSYVKSGSTPNLVGISISYAGVTTVSATAQIGYGNSNVNSSQAFTTTANSVVLSFHHAWMNTVTSTLSAPNHTQRQIYAGATNAAPSMLVQDYAVPTGTTTVTNTAAISNSAFWGCLTVNLS